VSWDRELLLEAPSEVAGEVTHAVLNDVRSQSFEGVLSGCAVSTTRHLRLFSYKVYKIIIYNVSGHVKMPILQTGLPARLGYRSRGLLRS
jgi:hypothetical protein